MNEAFSFDIDADHHARQLVPDRDRAALTGLGQRCVEYLRAATRLKVEPHDVARAFQIVLQPREAMQEPGFLLGIFSKAPAGYDQSSALIGVLSFLRPLVKRETWYLNLLLLEPAARGKGLGTKVHREFVQWAMARGANRLVLTVLEDNLRGGHFWRDRMGYQEVDAHATNGNGPHPYRVLEQQLHAARVTAPWAIYRPSDPLAA